MSASTRHGSWNAPTRFLPWGRSIAVLPPTLLSTCASKVVGTCTQLSPRIQIAAAKPVRSPTTPPPSAITTSRRDRRAAAKTSISDCNPAQPLLASPEGTSTGASDATPASARLAASAGPYIGATAASATISARRWPSAAMCAPASREEARADAHRIFGLADGDGLGGGTTRGRVSNRLRDRLGRGSGVHRQIGQRVIARPCRVQPRERVRRAAAEQRPPRAFANARGEHGERRVQMHRHRRAAHQCAGGGIGERAATECDQRGRTVQQFGQRRAFGGAERPLAAREQRRDGAVARLDRGVRVDERQVQARRRKRANRGFAAAGHADQRDVADHAISAPSARIRSAKPGKLVAIMSASRTVTGARAPRPSTRNAIAIR